MNTTTTTESGQSYNGWSNYETWAVALWLDNEASSYEWARDLARYYYDEARATSYATHEQSAGWALAEALRDHHDECNPLADEDVAASVFSDLIGSALDRVDWHEIAHNLVTEAVQAIHDDAYFADDDDDPEPVNPFAREGGLLDEIRQAEALLGGSE